MFASVLPLADALNNTPVAPAAIDPDVMLATVSEASSSSSKTYGVLLKLIGAPVLLNTSTHSQFGSGEAGSYMISVIKSPDVAPPPGTVPGVPRSATSLIATPGSVVCTLVCAPEMPLTLENQLVGVLELPLPFQAIERPFVVGGYPFVVA